VEGLKAVLLIVGWAGGVVTCGTPEVPVLVTLIVFGVCADVEDPLWDKSFDEVTPAADNVIVDSFPTKYRKKCN
jgi:hypothetical protein